VSELLVVIRSTPDQERGRPARERVSAQRVAARAALDEAAARLGLAVEHWPQVEDGGRPLPVEGWHWSISHDDTYVAAVLDTAPIGVDLERISDRRPELHDRIADPRERELLTPWDALAFTRLWTAKEAVLKAAGVGIAELSECRLGGREGEELLLDHRGGARRVVQHRVDQHVFALHARDLGRVRWELPG
jgi:4'-phosphopantetheinyl transferase